MRGDSTLAMPICIRRSPEIASPLRLDGRYTQEGYWGSGHAG